MSPVARRAAGASFALLCAYYLLKTAREPLVLASGGALAKSASTGVQAMVLAAILPFASRLLAGRRASVGFVRIGVGLALACAGFALAAAAARPAVGTAFYVFVGLFGVSAVANLSLRIADVVSEDEAATVVPVALAGSTFGGIAGSTLASLLYAHGGSSVLAIGLAAVLVVVHVVLGAGLHRGAAPRADAVVPPVADGLAMLGQNRALLGLAALVVVTNLVNTVGELVLSAHVTDEARAELLRLAPSLTGEAASARLEALIGARYGRFFSAVNLATVALQLGAASVLARRLGGRLLRFAPLAVAVVAYGGAAAGLSVGFLFAGKVAENATDYSLGATGRTLFWVDRARGERFAAKPFVDTLLVRLGDLLAALAVATAHALAVAPGALALANAAAAGLTVLAGLWLARRPLGTPAAAPAPSPAAATRA